MRIAKKISISLFITVLFCSLFYFFALSGLFDYIETSFFHPRVQQRYQGMISDVAKQMEQFYTSNRSRFTTVSSAPAISDLFSFERSQETIAMVETLFGELRSQLPALAFTRIFDISAQRLWFSTYATDIVRDTSVSRQYVSVSALDSEYFLPAILSRRIEEKDLLFDPSANQFIFRYSVKDNFEIPVGFAVYHVGLNDLGAQFVQDGIIELGEKVVILENDAVLINFHPRLDQSVRTAIEGNWQSILQNREGFPVLSDNEEDGYVIFSERLSSGGNVVMIARESEFVLSETTRLAFMVLIAFSLFLIVFLILNLRQDRMVIIASRIKRFQLDLLRGYIEGKASIDIRQWRADLEERRSELTVEIKRGLGDLKRNEAEEVDELIQRSWDNIIEALSDSAIRTGTSVSMGSEIDLSRLEKMLERVAARISSSDSAIVKSTMTDMVQPQVAALGSPPLDAAPIAAADSHMPSRMIEIADAEEVVELSAVDPMAPELPAATPQSTVDDSASQAKEAGSLDSILLEVWDNLDDIPELSDDSSEYSRGLHDHPVEITNMPAASDRAGALTDVATLEAEDSEPDEGEPVTEIGEELNDSGASETEYLVAEARTMEHGIPEDVSLEGIEAVATHKPSLFARLMTFRSATEEHGLEAVASEEQQPEQAGGIDTTTELGIADALEIGAADSEIDELEPLFPATPANDVAHDNKRNPELAELARVLLDE